MKKKLYIIVIFCLLFGALLSQKSFAKYILQDNLKMSVYIDKTPPIINVITNGEKETFNKTQTDIEKRTDDIIVNTNDNIKIKTNEYYYNPSRPNFEEVESNIFEGNKSLTNEGYYKIVATDTSSNKTEIIILIDKTPPTVTYRYFKKGESPTAQTKVMAVAGKKDYKKTNNIIDREVNDNIENDVKSDEIEVNNIQKENIKNRAISRSIQASITVSNENDLRNAINNGYSTIIISTSINCYNALTIKDNITIRPSSNENAIRFSGWGSFITIQSGATLTLDSIVIDCRGMSNNRGVTAINVQSNGKLVLKTNSIIDTGAGNTGTVINSGATAQIHSCHYAFADKGIVVKGNGSLSFYNTEGGRCSEFWNNTTAISFENFTGTCNFNQSNIRIRNNTNGIIFESGTGTVNISNAEIYSNSGNGLVCTNGNVNFSGGSIYSNGNGILQRNSKLNISGGTIRNNTNGINLQANYSGKMTITNTSIYSNSQYAIYHNQNVDGNCNIYGGSISGKIYLGQNDNYVNTNDKYPTFEVTPSSYYFKRKLVKTNSNQYAKNEISKITMTAKDNWYKYVNEEYIVVWRGCNVIIKNVDFFGNLLSTETITGNLGENYITNPKQITGYDLISTPSNSSGKYTENDITVEYKYDIVNCVIVNYEDLLSNVISAKYWYNSTDNSFSGNGTDFSNGTVFENYGYYKVVVQNGVGLQKEVIFTLNKDSLKR